MKKNFSTLFAFFCFFVLFALLGVSAKDGLSSATIFSDVLRLHVIANSDSKADQDMKYRVRDGILDVTYELFSDCTNADEAVKIAEDNRDLLKDAAKRVLVQNSSGQDVSILVGKEHYPEKTYGGFVFPQGEYLSVRVIIGDGKGKNWWCVLFPPLCNVGVTEGGRVLSSYGINEQEVEKLKNKSKREIALSDCRITLKIFDLFD